MSGRMKVLYVDDEPGLLEVAKLFLERNGQISVDTRTSAKTALRLLESAPYDAIISDYQMPGIDGIEFLKTVRASGNTIPFILFTGRGREEVVIQALNEGADFYLQKGGEPVAQFTELAHKIRQAVQQRRAEASIRDHERREAEIINFLPDATFAIDTNGVVIAWNRAMETMTGVPATEILGKGNYAYAVPFYHERRPILIDLVLKDDPATEAKYPYVTRSRDKLFSEITIPFLNNGAGSALWFTASPLYDTKGTIVGAIESIRDVTERKRAEEALRESEERLSSIFGAAQVGIILVDAATHQILQANAKALDLFGAAEQDVTGKVCHTFICPAEKGRCPVTDLSEVIDSSERVIIAGDGRRIPVLKTVVQRQIGGRDVLIESFVDITDRKRMVEELEESERRYRGVVETQTEFVCRFLPDGTHVFVNEAYCRYFGKNRNEIIGHRFRPEIPAEDREMVREHFASLTRDHPVAYTEHRIILPDGKVRWQGWSDHAIFDESGRLVEYQATGKDITDRKRAEEALREREATLASIFRAAPTGIGMVVNRIIMKVNDRLCEMTGYTAGELLGKSARILYPTDEDFEYVGREKYEQIRKSGTGTVETHWLRKDGTIRDVLLSSTPLDPADYQKGVTFTALDITSRKQVEESLRRSEEQYRLINDSSRDFIYSYDRSGRFTSANRSLCQAMNLAPDHIIGRTHAELGFPVDQCREWDELHRRVYDTGTTVISETSTPMPDKKVCFFEVVLNPIHDASGTITGISGTARDITDPKRAEERLNTGKEPLMPDSVLSPEVGIDEKDLATIIDSPTIQSMMEDFARLTGMATAIIDINGNIIEAAGWQDICIRFHRANAETSRFCRESDLYLAQNMKPGEHVAYKCRNHLWDVVTPLYIGDTHIGNVYTGQFFYDDEIIDEADFAAQAEKYGFNKDEYLAALRRVPRVSRDKINDLMSYLVKFTAFISQLSYSNLKLARTMAEEKQAKEALIQSERRLGDIIDHLPDATLAIDKNGKVIAWNRAMEEMTGVRAEDMLGKGEYEYGIPFYGVRRPVLIDWIFASDEELEKKYTIIKREGSLIVAEIDLVLPDGRNVSLWGKATPLYDDRGNKIGAIESIRDVTDNKRAETDLRRLYAELEQRVAERTAELSRAKEVYQQANEKLNLLNSITRHDISNQLIVLQGFLALLSAKITDTSDAEMIRKAQGAGRAIQHQIAFTRDYQDIGVKSPRWQDIGDTILQVMGVLPHEHIAIGSDLGNLEVYADPLLEKVVYNLIDNAVRYGEKITRIRFSCQESPEGMMVICEDDGAGISAEDKSHLFTKGFGKNTGLGLFLSREILGITGLTIHETGEPGKGARFEITVPKGAWRNAGERK